jgi:TRAP-type C4-dicarboxylate transport system permease large subunit
VSFNQSVLNALRSVTDNGHLVLLMMLGIILILTMFLESLAVLIVFVPVAVYVAQAYGFDPLHMGILMIVVNQMGALTPPVAVLLFITSAIAEARYMETVKHAWPFLVILTVYLLILTFVPEISTTIPRMLGR